MGIIMEGHIEYVRCRSVGNGSQPVAGPMNAYGYNEAMCEPVQPIEFAIAICLVTVSMFIIIAFGIKRLMKCMQRSNPVIPQPMPIATPTTTDEEEMKEQSDALRPFADSADVLEDVV